MTATKQAAVDAVAPAGPEDCIHKNKKINTPDKPLNARQRMIVAQKVIDGMPFAKDQSNSQYKSIPIDAMRSAVRRACIEAGLTHELVGVEYKREVRGSGTYFYEGQATMRFTSVDDSTDFVDHPTLGSAMDNGDKGIGKLVTNLIKNAYKETFDIGERGKDDIDSYANEDIEAEADRIAERKAKRMESARKDPFFAKAVPAEQPDDAVVRMRKQVGAFSMMGEPYESIIQKYKTIKPFAEWDKDLLSEALGMCVKAQIDAEKAQGGKA